MTDTTILPTENPDWGLYGTLRAAGFQPDRGWEAAFRAIADECGSDVEAWDIQAFLDSRWGRHFADEMTGMIAGSGYDRAAARTARAWQAWTITARTSRDTGIPAGLPYLTGFVLDAGIQAQA